ncbi:Lrp/AsnC family transcriptional regulator [Candidatus Woesearchaeota archaeon]|nr:Lrp/AsnC family transcriptional regulator [Candidatus Woesearchaeota archaeon]
MAIKIDLKDRKILYQLDVNSRQPNSEIAKKVGLSKQVVGFRIKRLVADKVIHSFYTVIDISKLGFTVHKNFLRLQNVDAKKEKEIVDFLVNHPNVVWVASCDGKFDLVFGTWAKDMAFLDRTITELMRKFGEYVAERQMASIIKGEYFIRDYLINKKEPSNYRESFFGAVAESAKIDEQDWKILSHLAKNSRLTAVEIASSTGLSADTVAIRIKKMEKSGIIKHYNFVPEDSVYPYIHNKVLLGLRNISEQKEKYFREYCRTNPNIVYMVNALGPWEIEIDIETDSQEQFRQIMMDIRTKFGDIMKDYSSLNIYKVYKYNFCPSIPQ